MNRSFCHLFFILLFTGYSLDAFAFNPKLKRGITDGPGTGGGTEGNEVKLPIGLPFQITDASTFSGSAYADGGVPVDQPAKIVYTFDLADGQTPESVHETHSAFEQARSMNAACVLIRMNSMSGALNAAANISNEISDYDRPVMVYINDKAISATTLISMAADTKREKSKVKSPKNSVIPKNQSTSNNGRNADFGISLDEKPCTPNLSNGNYGKNPFATGQNGDLDEVLEQAGLNNYTVVHYSPGFFAQLINLCMKPWVSILFVLLITIGIKLQISSPFPGPATFLLIVSIPLFGIPLFVGGLSGIGELGLLMFLILALVVQRKKSKPQNYFSVILGVLLIFALAICQTENLSQINNWSSVGLTILYTAVAFILAWFLPSLLNQFLKRSLNRFLLVPKSS